MRWFAQAPTNIALIKYMGKLDGSENLAANDSLSYTLNNLYSRVELETHSGDEDCWEPLTLPHHPATVLSTDAKKRFLQHLHLIKRLYHSTQGFIVRSANNFPANAGLASSASSFAALTQCAVNALAELTNRPPLENDFVADISRVGSGSSCRSFYKPWALWHDEGVNAVDLPYTTLIHQAVIVSRAEKTVSSSEAHRRVVKSPYFAERIANVAERAPALFHYLHEKNWSAAYQLAWQEFQEMHDLFTLCDPAFSYMTDDTQRVLTAVQDCWFTHADGPLATVDAGPNVHLLFRADQDELAEVIKQQLQKNYDVI
jgi:diphosphomevalonate decarboxylase